MEVLFPFTAVKNLYISKKFGHVSPPLCKSSPRVEWQQCCPPFRIFSWRGSSHRNLSRKALGSSFLADSSPITLLPYLPGTETRNRAGHWRSMVDECPLLSMFCPINILCCMLLCSCPYYVPLHLLFGSWDISLVTLLTIIRDLISWYVYMLCRVGIPNCSSPAICNVWHHRTNTNTPYRRPKIGLGYCVSQQQPAVVQLQKTVMDRDEIS